jgi:N-acetylneuraminic acid mutarotase
MASPAWAHFAWLVISPNGKQVEIYFSESATENDPDLLDYVAQSKLWRVAGDQTTPLEVKQTDEAVSSALDGAESAKSLIVLRHGLGVVERGGATFLLNYYAKTGPGIESGVWENVASQKVVDLDIVPKQVGQKVQLNVVWKGKPRQGAEVVVSGPGIDDSTQTSDGSGVVTFTPGDSGLYSIRARHIEKQSGEVDGKKYDSVRHYATLALPIGDATSAAAPKPKAQQNATKQYPDMPLALASFGAAIVGDDIYAYGGHSGEAHSYSTKEQSNQLLRLDIADPKEWTTIAQGPRLQGLALVAVDDQLYRIGGFAAKNEDGEAHDLWSQSGVAIFDLAANKWRDAPALPEPRSSLDAAVLDGKIYVAGGWQLRGGDESLWHKTAWRLDSAAKSPKWEALPAPPFQRRAVALAAYGSDLYVLGGMQQEGGPTTRVDIFDTEHGKWRRGPDLPGKPLEGFGCAGFAGAGRLYVSTMSGKLLRLSTDGESWETTKQLETARFFHRMLPYKDTVLFMLGGANMSIGKFQHVDAVPLK